MKTLKLPFMSQGSKETNDGKNFIGNLVTND